MSLWSSRDDLQLGNRRGRPIGRLSPAYCPPDMSTLAVMHIQSYSPRWSKAIDAALAAHAAAAPELKDAVLVRAQDDAGNAQAHRIYRAKDGQYFLFICTVGGPGYLTWLTWD